MDYKRDWRNTIFIVAQLEILPVEKWHFKLKKTERVANRGCDIILDQRDEQGIGRF